MIGAATRLAALVGHPVGHSLSPAMQNAAFEAAGVDGRYLAFDVAPGRLKAALKGLAALGALGVNVTIPHKTEAFGLCDWVEPKARALGAVNVVLFREQGLLGHNSDIDGVEGALDELPQGGKRALLLGAGGSARAAAAALMGRGFSLVLANRTEERARRTADDVVRGLGRRALSCLAWDRFHQERFDLVVNATSLGLESNPWPDGDLNRLLGALEGASVVDLVYRPRGRTALAEAARRAGSAVAEGQSVLLHQGMRSFFLFTGREAPRSAMAKALEVSR